MKYNFSTAGWRTKTMSRLKTTDKSRMDEMLELKVPEFLEYFRFWLYWFFSCLCLSYFQWNQLDLDICIMAGVGQNYLCSCWLSSSSVASWSPGTEKWLLVLRKNQTDKCPSHYPTSRKHWRGWWEDAIWCVFQKSLPKRNKAHRGALANAAVWSGIKSLSLSICNDLGVEWMFSTLPLTLQPLVGGLALGGGG